MWVVALVSQRDMTAGPGQAAPGRARRALQGRGRLTANLGSRPVRRIGDDGNANNLQQLKRGLEAHVGSLAPLELADEADADAPASRELSATQATVPAGILEQRTNAIGEHVHLSRLIQGSISARLTPVNPFMY